MNEAIANVIKTVFNQDVEVNVTRPEPQFGDATTNVALQLAKPLGKNPREIAEEIAEKLRETGEYEAVDVAGPGFINVTFGSGALLEQISREPSAPRLG